MARVQAESAVDPFSFDDLVADEDENAAESAENGVSSDVITVDDAVSEVKKLVEDAVDFMNSTLVPEWERAEEFFNGETDLQTSVGRSQVVETVVRDAVRSILPNVMRVFVQADKIVEFEPPDGLNFASAALCEAQTKFCNQLFWSSGGYLALLNSSSNAILKKVGVLKSSFVKNISDEYVRLTNVSPEELDALYQMEDVVVVSVDGLPDDDDPLDGATAAALLQCEVVYRRESGKVCLSDVNLTNFFVDENATCPEDAAVIGERNSVTVSYARSIGLEYDDWEALSDFDPEQDDAGGESEARRGYTKNHQTTSVDPSNHRFLLTEAYARFDLDGTGVAQLYRFWLGGADYEYIAHERVDDNPYSVILSEPVPGAFFGRSFFDVLRESQNVQTSLLRATCDNAHASNNRRLAVHESLVNMQDVMNPRLGAPIRFRSPGMIQEIGVESTLGTMLPLLQHLKQTSEDKVGVTAASMGLDPDALQSTDKDAVRNTIQLAQGQVELICRNIAETGLRDAFIKLLKLSLRHNPRQQLIAVNGTHIPVDQTIFDPELRLEARVGLGTNSPDTQLAALQQIATLQKEMMMQYGLNNPVCNVNHFLTTIADMGRLMGVKNMGRYFSQITPDLVNQLEQIAAQKAQAAQGEPPSAAVAIAEQIRAESRIKERMLTNDSEAAKRASDTVNLMTKLMLDDDYKRDKMAQDLAIADAQIKKEAVDEAFVQYEQNQDRNYELHKMMIDEARRRMEFEDQVRMMNMQAQQQAAQAAQQPQKPSQGA